MRLRIVAAVNNPTVLARNLLASPGISGVHQKLGSPSAAKAFNAALEELGEDDIVAFIHQDVYLPAGWFDKAHSQIERIAQDDPNWAVLGVWGRCSDGRYSGRVWCTSRSREYIGNVPPPAVVRSVDEVVIVLNSKHGLRFDERLPGFHLYGTDIVMEAQQRGLRSYSIEAPVVHNSTYKQNIFDASYRRSYNFVRQKWRDQLPIYTCCLPVTRTRLELCRSWIERKAHSLLKGTTGPTAETDPKVIAQSIGYEPLE